ncbi:shikimate kinase [Bacillus sp. FJAT-50079]|uniref:AAA family ATPase n=1 Tax=Bacillus sp. FJAT-50079 TaxID=2833577 RepID=UPI001BC90396|nr:shikimate kinase [Bacillus sp. FJAT-50079]MBS4207227.1 DNA topology modulation protein FlaR [Bacillus sp. FJAT-50079]
MERTIPNKIHIIGSIGSGKTTLAKTLSNRLKIPYYELDNVVWKRFDTGDIRRTEQERDEYLNSITNNKKWIIEGVHHTWVCPCFHHAELILFLDTDLSTRRMRIIKRFFRQKMGIEKANYKPTLKIFKDLYNYNTVFEYKSKPEIFDMLTPYNRKLVILKDNAEAIHYFN